MTNQPARRPTDNEELNDYAIDLHWIPIRTRGTVARHGATFYELIDALVTRRDRRDLYHSALRVRVPHQAVVIEMTHLARECADERGVIAEGPVGVRSAARWRVCRYEIRCWPDGDIRADASTPVRLSADSTVVRRLFDLAPYVPMMVWGRDEVRAGEPWTSNSIVSWLLERAGMDAAHIPPPEGGRAPGWAAGISAARRGPLTAPTPPRTRPRRTLRLRIAAPRRIAAPMVVDELSTSR
jgi:hypothetical protein